MSISVQMLTKSYGVQKALDGVSFDVNKGEIVGLLGPNGAGKTTTMKIVSGFMQQFDGEAFVNGLSVREDPLGLKRSLGYLPEHNPLYLDMYVKEYLHFVGTIYKLTDIGQKVQSIVDRTGLQKEQHKQIKALSKGYRQRVGLAQALIHDPSVLILDEPTSGLDPNQLVEIRQLIRDIGSEKTVIFSSHIMQEVQALCDRVIILNSGKIVADDKIDILEHQINSVREIIVQLDQPISTWKLHNLKKQESLSGGRYRLLFKKANRDPRVEIFDYVVQNNVRLLEMHERKSNIEDVFQKLTRS